MAQYRSPSYSPCTSASSPSASTPSSSNPSPAFPYTPLAPPSIMVQRSNSRSSSRSNGSAGSRESAQTQTVSKGGCWTCRLRRKKCDELRENGSCHTCNRLNIKCLGWGSKRPDWMRNKQCVDAYKADIKAQLTRAGLIRGQPRTAAVRLSNSPMFSQPYPIPAVAGPGPDRSPAMNGRNGDANPRRPGSRVTQSSLQMSMPDTPPNNGNFLQLPAASFSEPNLNALNLDFSSPFQFSPLQSAPIPLPHEQSNFGYDFSAFSTSPHLPEVPLEFDLDQRLTDNVPLMPSIQSPATNHILYYFDHVSRCCSAFGSEEPTAITYSLILQDHQGPVSNAICSLASLHEVRSRGAKDAREYEPAKRFYDEACHQLHAKRMHGPYGETDAFAALHLISYSLLSGGETPWQWLFELLLEWVSQSGLTTDENPAAFLSGMSDVSRCAFKLIMWIDVFSSVPIKAVPKLLSVYRRIYQQRGRPDSNDLSGAPARGSCFGMELLTGCPDDCMMAIAETAALINWKWMENKKGSLSIRELVRRADLIERQYRRNSAQPVLNQAPLDQQILPSTHSIHSLDSPSFSSSHRPRQETYAIYREFVEMLLQVAVSGWNHLVPEVSASIDRMFTLLSVFPGRASVSINLPLLVIGGMLDNPTQRDFIRKKMLDERCPVGNSLQAALVMEALWHERQNASDLCERIEAFAGHFSKNLII